MWNKIKKKKIVININNFKIETYQTMIDNFGLTETWSFILDFLTDKTIIELKYNKLLEFDNLGELYEIGLAYSNKITKKDTGKYYTPKDVSLVMSELLLENKFETIADVGCGTGNLIITLLSIMKDKTGIDPVDFIRDGGLYLYDMDSVALEIFLKKIDILFETKVSNYVNKVIGDFLNKENLLPAGVSVITNPPYALIKKFDKTWNIDEVTLQSKDLYAAFINKITNYCEHAVIVSPQSYLVAAKFSKLRTKLSKHFYGEIYSFDNVPGTLFNGKKHGIFNSNTANGVRASITSIKRNGHTGFKLSHLIRFRNGQRQKVINLDFLRSKLGTIEQMLDQPIKAFKELEPMIKEITIGTPKYVSELIEFDPSLQNPDYKMFVSTSARYFTLASKKSLNRKGYFIIYAKNKFAFELLYSLLNSSYAYMWWRFSDGGILFSKRNLFSMPYHKKLFEKIKEIENIICMMIKSESYYVSYKINAGEQQESIKFPEEFRSRINEVLFPKYAKDMELLHKNHEVSNGK